LEEFSGVVLADGPFFRGKNVITFQDKRNPVTMNKDGLQRLDAICVRISDLRGYL